MTIAACAAVAAAVPLFFSLMGVTGNDLVHAAVTGADSLSDLLSKRSPGERTAAQLTKTKRAKHTFSAVAPPEQRHLAPPVVGKPNFHGITQLLAPPPVDIAPPSAQFAFNAPTLPDVIGASGPGVLPGSPGGGDSNGGGGGGGGGPVSFPTAEPHVPLTPVSPLPEPGTWATMLVGFGLMGWRLRRRSLSTGSKALA
jgi:hypothetical protein